MVLCMSCFQNCTIIVVHSSQSTVSSPCYCSDSQHSSRPGNKMKRILSLYRECMWLAHPRQRFDFKTWEMNSCWKELEVLSLSLQEVSWEIKKKLENNLYTSGRKWTRWVPHVLNVGRQSSCQVSPFKEYGSTIHLSPTSQRMCSRKMKHTHLMSQN